MLVIHYIADMHDGLLISAFDVDDQRPRNKHEAVCMLLKYNNASIW